MSGDEYCWPDNWEKQCVESIENQPDYEQALSSEYEAFQHKMWTNFQDSATAVAQIYRDKHAGEGGILWIQFQNAAGALTGLYKDSSEGLKKTIELSKLCGQQKRNNELLNWVRRKGRYIKRGDVLAFLANKAMPPRQSHHHRLSPRPRNISPPPHHRDSSNAIHFIDPNLHTFREALHHSRMAPRSTATHSTADLCTFISGEMARHGAKRSASPSDVPMGSPTHTKRSRYM